MRIKHGKYGCSIVLGDSETRTWMRGDPSSFELRAKVRKVARTFASPGKSVEIYASAKYGKWVADIIEAP
jgi:hypothetical protein